MSTVAATLMEQILDSSVPGPHHAEAQLVERCVRGDSQAFQVIYQSNRQVVFGVIARMFSNEADREEVVQDVFLQVHRSLKNFRGTSKLSTWIHRIAVNVALQHIRKKGRRVQLHLCDELPDRLDMDAKNGSPATPESNILEKERRTAVQRALDALAPKKRMALILADFEGMTSKEISQIVDAPALTVRTRLYYARKSFYARLAKDPAFAGVSSQEMLDV